MRVVTPFSDEQARTLVNLRQRYETWNPVESGDSAFNSGRTI